MRRRQPTTRPPDKHQLERVIREMEALALDGKDWTKHPAFPTLDGPPDDPASQMAIYRLARRLHRRAGVPPAPLEPAEVEKFASGFLDCMK